MKVLLINPWGVNNDQFYTSGFIHGMNNCVSLSFASNYYYNGEMPNGELYQVFFKRTEKMPHSTKRKLMRGVEYIHGWEKILRIVKKEEFDVIHIHWLLMYKVDRYFIPKLKKHCKKLILTAHNIIPHVDGEKNLEDLKILYAYFDTVLVHGEALILEFKQYFPELADRLHVQHHGEYFGQSTECCADSDSRVKNLTDEKIYNKRFIIFGNQFYNKGTDRVARIWLDDKRFDDSLLIIAGRLGNGYPQMTDLIPEIEKRHNILLLDYFVDDDILNYLIRKSDAVVIPYRHASMSGVLHTAAVFEKPVICTKTGVLAEYLEDGNDSIVCENTDESVHDALIEALSLTSEELADMGKTLHDNITKKYSWEIIAMQLYHDVYMTPKACL